MEGFSEGFLQGGLVAAGFTVEKKGFWEGFAEARGCQKGVSRVRPRRRAPCLSHCIAQSPSQKI